MINRSEIPDDLIQGMVDSALEAYHTVFPKPGCDVEITVCRDLEDLADLAEEYVGEREEFREYDGVFPCPKGKGDPFRILVVARDKAVTGAGIFFSEVEKGSRRDETMPMEEREKRGIELAGYCHFAEMVQHEYSHLCSFERLMQETGWEDPGIGGHNMDYHLYDEMIARYRGTYAMLHMMDDYLERDLLYTLWMGYWKDILDEFERESDLMKKAIAQNRDDIEDLLLSYMEEGGMSSLDVSLELEFELGHPLEYEGEFTEKGVPRLSPVEAVEFMMVDDGDEISEISFRRGLPLLYFAHHPHASYHGAQLAGLVHAFYDFLSGKEERLMDLASFMEKPYYETLDVAELKSELEELMDLIRKRP